MKKPNQELFRLLRFAINYPGWTLIGEDSRKHIRRGVELGFFEIDAEAKQWRLKTPIQSR